MDSFNEHTDSTLKSHQPPHSTEVRSEALFLKLIRELSKISYQFESNVEADWMVRRLLFFAYELEAEINQEDTEEDRLTKLNRFFFTQKKFQCTQQTATFATTQDLILCRVVTERTGSPDLIALVYAFLAEHIDVRLQLVDLRPSHHLGFLKWTNQGRSQFLDISRNGNILSSEDLIETLLSRIHPSAVGHNRLLETLTCEGYLTVYLHHLKKSLLEDQSELLMPVYNPELQISVKTAEKLLFLQNTLIENQPGNLQLLAERAILYRQLGNLKGALADLKRYFTFHDLEKSPSPLVRLFEKLLES